MSRIIKYTEVQSERAIMKMYDSGLTAGDKNKIIKARKFPKNALDNFDTFKTYFLSGEGLPNIIKTLSEKEIVVLHILAFNHWITDVSIFESAYIAMPERAKYYWNRQGTYTQKYGAVLKIVQSSLVQKGLLVKYENKLGGDSKTERQRFLFPAAFVDYLPSPFSSLTELKGNGTFNDESIRKEIISAINSRPKQLQNGLVFKNKKIYLKKKVFDLKGITQIQFRYWRLTKGAYILSSQYFDNGATLADFVLYYLQQLAPNQWFSEKSVTTLLSIWDDPKKRQELDIDRKYQSRYQPKEWCEAGFNTGLLEKQSNNGINYYRLFRDSKEPIDYGKYLRFQADETLIFNSKTIPLPIWIILNQISFFEPSTAITLPTKPDLVHISNFPESIWSHPLIQWLEENAPTFKTAFATFQKKFGKEIIHGQLLVAKITDLSLRVLVEKNLKKADQIVILSDDFIAFPIDALSLVERIVAKSGNVIKRITP